MVLADGLLGLVFLGLWLFCIIDVITTDEALIRNLQKPIWLLIVIFLVVLGAVLWLIAGRPRAQTPGRGSVGGYPSRSTPAFPEYDRPGRYAASNPDDDEEFLRQIRERAEEQRRRHREQQRKDDEGPDKA
jgi:hypothetical protein